jgi:hypothetical protein
MFDLRTGRSLASAGLFDYVLGDDISEHLKSAKSSQVGCEQERTCALRTKIGIHDLTAEDAAPRTCSGPISFEDVDRCLL